MAGKATLLELQTEYALDDAVMLMEMLEWEQEYRRILDAKGAK